MTESAHYLERCAYCTLLIRPGQDMVQVSWKGQSGIMHPRCYLHWQRDLEQERIFNEWLKAKDTSNWCNGCKARDMGFCHECTYHIGDAGDPDFVIYDEDGNPIDDGFPGEVDPDSVLHTRRQIAAQLGGNGWLPVR